MKAKLALGSLLTLLVSTVLLPPPASAAGEWVQIGVVGVDSGQLVLLDPAYVDSEWVGKGQGEDWRVRYWGRDAAQLTGGFGPSPIACKNAQEAAAVDAKIRARCEEQDLSVVTWPQSGSSYDKCAELTSGERQAGQLDYRRGHAGMGVALTTGYGDGVYPVYARYDGDVLVEVRVLFDADGEGHKRMSELVERQQKAEQKAGKKAEKKGR